MTRIFTHLIFATLILGLFENCSKTNFSGSDDTSSTQSCSSELRTLTVPIKLLFVVDTSGSNADGPYYSGSDPGKSIRGGSIQKFFNDYGSHSNFSWGFITFSGSTARSLIGSSSSSSFTTNKTVMQNAINSFYSLVDSDLTPYRAALLLATQALASDPTWTKDTKYIVVFISDGVPDPYVDDATLQSDVSTLMNQHSNQITFNAIYYGTYDADASDRLTKMTSIGHGKFLDTNTNQSGTDFEISDTVNIPGENCGS